MKNLFYLLLLVASATFAQTEVNSLKMLNTPATMDNSANVDILVRENTGVNKGMVRKTSWSFLKDVFTNTFQQTLDSNPSAISNDFSVQSTGSGGSAFQFLLTGPAFVGGNAGALVVGGNGLGLFVDGTTGAVTSNTPDLSSKSNEVATTEFVKNVLGYAFPEDYGAIPNDAIDDSSAIIACLLANDKVAFKGVYVVSSTVEINSGKMLFGYGQTSKLTTTSDITVLRVVGANVTIENLTFEGSGKDTGLINQIGVWRDRGASSQTERQNLKITNCNFYSFGLAGYYSTRHRGLNYMGGTLLTSCFARGNNVGFFCALQGEYNSFVNCQASENNDGVYIIGGNNNWVGGQLTGNINNFRLGTGLNDGHCTIEGAKINHATAYNILADDVLNGYRFTNCDIYNAPIRVDGCANIRFIGGEIGFTGLETEALYILSSTVRFQDVYFIRTPVTYSFTGSTIEWLENKFLEPIIPGITNRRLQDMGTVTSVTGTNGVTVATGTTTPVIGLGNITPSSVASSGTITGSNLSGTNTGDNATNTTSDAFAQSLVTQTVTNGVTTSTSSQDAIFDFVVSYIAGSGGTTPASEATAGIAEIATQTETNAGTDDARFVTPLKLKTYADASFEPKFSTGATGFAYYSAGVRTWVTGGSNLYVTAAGTVSNFVSGVRGATIGTMSSSSAVITSASTLADATAQLQNQITAMTAYSGKTANYTLTVSDFFVDLTANSATFTLPTAVGIAGKQYVVKNSGSGTVLTLATTSSQTIDGTTTKTFNTQYAGIRVASDGANWKIIGTY